jgi:hypothetical protein
MKTRYSFIFFTGHGIGEIWQHTINTYPIHIHAENVEEALIKMNKKKGSLYKYKVFARYNPERWISSSDLLVDLDTIFFKQIEDHFKNNVFPEEELVSMQELYNSKKLWRENYGKSITKS